MRVGLFFGSFNPVHTGHLIIANHIASYYTSEVWFVISPQNPFKNLNELLVPRERLALTKLATEKDERFKVSDIEFHLPIPSYTINTLHTLSNQYKNLEFCLIMGSDNIGAMHSWKSYQEIIENYPILVYERPHYPTDKIIAPKNFKLISPGLVDISSTQIRKLIQEGKSIRYLLPEIVRLEIENKDFYK